ncbi:hypothetical protein Tsubulata_039218 [Turnera subulata]|uniref:Water stress and hypersensitive response domain-containing protein n=1 Tax=Turnera subulata TaxID=218843 RepID=A0A9Q0F3H3_9ROSI|nr:hypothetical protein Tsubulata_039218 [Turnera subulata]
MREQEQVWPLAPASNSQRSDHLEEATPASAPDAGAVKKPRSRRCMKCWVCMGAIFLILATLILVLIFTVFRTKDPVITMNSITITQLQLVNGTTIPKPGTNISFVADVSVKNPNYASFKYRNTTTSLYYRGRVAGQARSGPGKARARRTVRMNVTVDVVPDKLMSSPNLTADLGSGILPMTTYSRVPGRMKIVFVKKWIVVKLNCSIAFNISRQAIESQKCRRNVDFF